MHCIFFLNLVGFNILPCHFSLVGSHSLHAVEFRNASTTGAMNSQMTRQSGARSRTMLTYPIVEAHPCQVHVHVQKRRTLGKLLSCWKPQKELHDSCYPLS